MLALNLILNAFIFKLALLWKVSVMSGIGASVYKFNNLISNTHACVRVHTQTHTHKFILSKTLLLRSSLKTALALTVAASYPLHPRDHLFSVIYPVNWQLQGISLPTARHKSQHEAVKGD